METQAEQPAGGVQCPTCGGPIDSDAAMCAACGTALTAETSSPPASGEPEGVPLPEPIPAATASGASSPVSPAADQKRCDWCGALNPSTVERCESCRAMFPRPDQDEAMRRAGEARIQAAEDEIALWGRMRKRRGLRGLFVGRKGSV